MAFWGQSMGSGTADPKRKFRFKVEIGGLGGSSVWYAKTVAKPTVNVSADTEHKYLGHTFKFPGSVSWDDIEVTLVDPADASTGGDAAEKLLGILEGAGYNFPRESSNLRTISKGKAASALIKVHIYQLDSEGNPTENWKLHNPFINKIQFGDLSYEDDGLVEVTLGLTFDWAEFNTVQGKAEFFEPPEGP